MFLSAEPQKFRFVESLTVPDTVILDGVEFQVERIAQSAFAGSDKLKEVLIQADVEVEYLFQVIPVRKGSLVHII